MATLELKNTFGKQEEGKFDFYKTIVSLSNIHNRNIEDNIVLAMYVAIENSAKDIKKYFTPPFTKIAKVMKK